MTTIKENSRTVATDNIKLVYKIAHQNKGYCETYKVDFEELVSIGTIGLMKAIEAYDPLKGKFSAIACVYIKGEIQHYFRDGKQTLMRNHRDKNRNYVSSLDAPLKHDSTTTKLDSVADTNFIEIDCDNRFIEEYRYCLPQLKWKEADAIQMSIDGLFDYEIAEWLEMSSTGIVALRQKAKVKIAKILAKDKNLKNLSKKNHNALPHKKNGVLEVPSFKSTCIVCSRFFGRWKTANNPPLCCGGTCARELANKKVQIGGRTWSKSEFALLDSLVNTMPYTKVIEIFRAKYPSRNFEAVRTKMTRRYKTIKSTKDGWNMRELSRILGISSDRIRIWIKRGLDYTRSGRIIVISRAAINDFCFREYARFYGINIINLAKIIDDPQLVDLCGQIPTIVKRIEYQRLDNKKVYKSLREASREMNMPRPSIVAAAKHNDGWIKKSTVVL